MDSYSIVKALMEEARCIMPAQVESINALAIERGVSWQRIYRESLRKGLQRLQAEQRFRQKRIAAIREAARKGE